MPRHKNRMLCRSCGCPLRKVTDGICPRCGLAFDPQDRSTWAKWHPDSFVVKNLQRAGVLSLAASIILIGLLLERKFPQAAVYIGIATALPVGLLLWVRVTGTTLPELWRVMTMKLVDRDAPPGKQSESLDGLVGKQGHVTVTLKPAGRITIDGREYEAKSESTFVAIGQPVHVIDTDKWALVVRSEDI